MKQLFKHFKRKCCPEIMNTVHPRIFGKSVKFSTSRDILLEAITVSSHATGQKPRPLVQPTMQYGDLMGQLDSKRCSDRNT